MKPAPMSLLTMLCLLLMVSCVGAETEPITEIQIETVRLQITPSLNHWLSAVSACAETIPNFGIVVDFQIQNELDIGQADLILRLGQRLPEDPYITLLGTETIVLFTTTELPITRLSLENLQAIYSGEIRLWQEATVVTEETSQPIVTLSYPQGHEIRQFFQESYLANHATNSNPLVFSTLAYLKTLLQDNPGAIGYSLQSHVPQGAKILEITGYDLTSAHHPVLAITQGEPQGGLRQLLLCLQNSKPN